MRVERQIELLDRVATAGTNLEGLYAASGMVNPASVYCDPDHFDREQAILFRRGPAFFGLSADLAKPGSYNAKRFAGIPLIVARQTDGSLKAFVNICRHRGAPLVETDTGGENKRSFTCPYHAWSYGIDGAIRARPEERAFADQKQNCNLLERPIAEKYGLIFVRPEGDEPIDIDDLLGTAADDMADFGIDRFVPIETRTQTWDLNWKLVLDTFTESYHIRTLHRQTIAPSFNSGCVIYDSFGRCCMSVGLRKSVFEELKKPREEWRLLPYGTIQYFLIPNGLVVYQLDHLEVWRVEPLAVDRTRIHTAIYSPTEPHSEKSRQYFVKNLDLLLKVTGSEDFPMMRAIQENLSSGAMPEVIYGRIEPPLIHLHSVINELVAAG